MRKWDGIRLSSARAGLVPRFSMLLPSYNPLILYGLETADF